MTGLFYVLYIVCGVSDILDGYLARRMNSASKLGAVLDSMADFLFTAVILLKLITVITLSDWMLIWLMIIVLIKMAVLLIGFKKYHSFAFLHTYMNKATGALLFCFPLFYIAFGITATAFVLLGIATLAAIEEFIITLTARELNHDVKSIFK